MSERRPLRRHRGGARAAVAGLVMAVVFATAVPWASAQLTDAVADGHTVTTGSLEPPTQPGTAPGTCVLLLNDEIVVSWTKSASSWADGYDILRSTTSGGPYSVVGTASGQTTQSYTDRSVGSSTVYYYVVQATKNNWRSAPTAEVSRASRSSLCT